MSLGFVDRVQVYFRDSTYRWLDAAHFAVSGAEESLAALEALLRHDQYVDHYMTADDVACTPDEADDIARQRAAFVARVMRDVPRLAKVAGRPSTPPRPRHGPYWADFVTLESFDQLDAEAALETVMAWLRVAGDCDRPVPAPEELDGDLPALLATFDAFAEVYRLRKLPATAQHDYGFVVHPYLELVGTDAHCDNLWLVAGGTD